MLVTPEFRLHQPLGRQAAGRAHALFSGNSSISRNAGSGASFGGATCPEMKCAPRSLPPAERYLIYLSVTIKRGP
jgi:hypothetical protein